jgi:hypothetical protein
MQPRLVACGSQPLTLIVPRIGTLFTQEKSPYMILSSIRGTSSQSLLKAIVLQP